MLYKKKMSSVSCLSGVIIVIIRMGKKHNPHNLLNIYNDKSNNKPDSILEIIKFIWLIMIIRW
jgi:hypothetical protein